RHRSCHLSSLYSPFLSFGDVAAKFVEAKAAGVAALRNFVNSWLAEPWEEAADRPQWDEVRARLSEPRPRGVVPPGCFGLTCGVDLQDYRCHWCVIAWGLDRRGYIVEWGESADLETFRDTALLALAPDTGLLSPRAWPASDAIPAAVPKPQDPEPQARAFEIRAIACDARWRSQYVLDFCADLANYGLARAFPIKGNTNIRARWQVAKIDVNRFGKTRLRSQRVMYINVDMYKPELYHALKFRRPGEPGSLTLPAQADEDFCRQITSEVRTLVTDRSGHESYHWVIADEIGNHYGDCVVYAMWAADYLGWLGRRTPNAPAPHGSSACVSSNTVRLPRVPGPPPGLGPPPARSRIRRISLAKLSESR
ncbi:MAG TPA: phage terminase large subunit family protein, partial [Candidatus Brocadiia bacterium]|nr:phage terminase large subunit family protein [Candidatus Brocadiia bacterium]